MLCLHFKSKWHRINLLFNCATEKGFHLLKYFSKAYQSALESQHLSYMCTDSCMQWTLRNPTHEKNCSACAQPHITKRNTPKLPYGETTGNAQKH